MTPENRRGAGCGGARSEIKRSAPYSERKNLGGVGALAIRGGPRRARPPRQDVEVRLTDPKTRAVRSITLMSRIVTPVEADYYRNGGILPTVLRKLAVS